MPSLWESLCEYRCSEHSDSIAMMEQLLNTYYPLFLQLQARLLVGKVDGAVQSHCY